MCTQYFCQCCGSSVQHEKSPKHCDHVEDDVTQKGAGGHGKRFDHSHAASNYCGNKYTRSWKDRHIPYFKAYFFHLSWIVRECVHTEQGSNSHPSSVWAGERCHGTKDVRGSVTQSKERHALSKNQSQGSSCSQKNVIIYKHRQNWKNNKPEPPAGV